MRTRRLSHVVTLLENYWTILCNVWLLTRIVVMILGVTGYHTLAPQHIWAFTPTSSACDVDERRNNAYVDILNLRVGSTRRVALLTNHCGLVLGNTLTIRWLRGTFGRVRQSLVHLM